MAVPMVPQMLPMHGSPGAYPRGFGSPPMPFSTPMPFGSPSMPGSPPMPFGGVPQHPNGRRVMSHGNPWMFPGYPSAHPHHYIQLADGTTVDAGGEPPTMVEDLSHINVHSERPPEVGAPFDAPRRTVREQRIKDHRKLTVAHYEQHGYHAFEKPPPGHEHAAEHELFAEHDVSVGRSSPRSSGFMPPPRAGRNSRSSGRYKVPKVGPKVPSHRVKKRVDMDEDPYATIPSPMSSSHQLSTLGSGDLSPRGRSLNSARGTTPSTAESVVHGMNGAPSASKDFGHLYGTEAHVRNLHEHHTRRVHHVSGPQRFHSDAHHYTHGAAHSTHSARHGAHSVERGHSAAALVRGHGHGQEATVVCAGSAASEESGHRSPHAGGPKVGPHAAEVHRSSTAPVWGQQQQPYVLDGTMSPPVLSPRQPLRQPLAPPGPTAPVLSPHLSLSRLPPAAPTPLQMLSPRMTRSGPYLHHY
eukprot:gnl/TRDRNA2_/TRDRNA2_177401_c0_seq27.p1 gnl/TRDRNA2_/TRDRNA2_177401_c0~~gnl/TRDRNA2_/TRDRNA2_177401_c0_seq27.p1  ORF type:complete len:469 (+),score=34.85 gnl/TRDRNA2_/TRDRNA2_177401_c0_seq27:58-1464(+)